MIELSDVTVKFGEKVVLNRVSLSVSKGENLAVMGSSGGGKTTLLRAISGLIKPNSGRITLAGVDVLAHPEEARRHMGMVFQSAALFDFLSVEENILFGIKRHSKLPPKDQKKLVDSSLERVGLTGTSHLKPAALSGGMRKRVGIARALALSPDVMLYDEPTTGLDPITTYQIDQLMHDLKTEEQMTSIIVSHDLTSVRRTADRVAFLHAGEVVFDGNSEAFMSSEHPAIKELILKTQSVTL